MPLGKGVYKAFVADRGGIQRIGSLDGLERITIDRSRDDIGRATLRLAGLSHDCHRLIADVHPVRHELVIERNGTRVFEGPITRLAYYANHVEVDASDVMWYLSRRVMERGYDYTGQSTNAVQFVARVIKEHYPSMNDPFNIGPFVQEILSPDDAKTAAKWTAYSRNLFEFVDKYAEDGGIDYVVIGRSIIIMDTHVRAHVIPTLTNDAFNSDVGIVEYGSELVTRAYTTDGNGNMARRVAPEPWISYYGPVDRVTTNVQEGDGAEGTAPQSDAFGTQSDRLLISHYPAPVDVLIPANSPLDACAAVEYRELHPGAWVRVDIEVGARRVDQWQRVQTVSTLVERGVEAVSVTLQQPPARWVDPL